MVSFLKVVKNDFLECGKSVVYFVEGFFFVGVSEVPLFVRGGGLVWLVCLFVCVCIAALVGGGSEPVSVFEYIVYAKAARGFTHLNVVEFFFGEYSPFAREGSDGLDVEVSSVKVWVEIYGVVLVPVGVDRVE